MDSTLEVEQTMRCDSYLQIPDRISAGLELGIVSSVLDIRGQADK